MEPWRATPRALTPPAEPPAQGRVQALSDAADGSDASAAYQYLSVELEQDSDLA